MNTELFSKLSPTKLFFRCTVPAAIISVFGALCFPVVFLILLTAVWGLNGVWLMSVTSACASGILTMFLAVTLKLDDKLREVCEEDSSIGG